MILERIAVPISVSQDDRDALRRHLLHTEGVWSRRGWDLTTFAAKWSDSCCLLGDLDREESHRGTVELALPPVHLRRVFTDIREGLLEIDDLDPEQVLIVAGACERALGALDEKTSPSMKKQEHEGNCNG